MRALIALLTTSNDRIANPARYFGVTMRIA
jgi:hypothetical protein